MKTSRYRRGSRKRELELFSSLCKVDYPYPLEGAIDGREGGGGHGGRVTGEAGHSDSSTRAHG